MEKNKKIYAFQGLRVVAMISIFLSHLTYLSLTKLAAFYDHVSYARFPVNLFFVLSGFLMAYMYHDRSSQLKWGAFVRKRYEKIYIPYLVCLLIGILHYSGELLRSEGLGFYFFRLLVSIPILQAAVPYSNVPQSFNGVAWFLSCTMIFYIITPFSVRINDKIRKDRKNVLLSLPLLLVLFGITYMVFRELEYYRFPDLHLSLVYSSPYIRIFAFWSGMLCYDLREIIADRCVRFSRLEVPAAVITFLWWVLAAGIPLPMVLQESVSISLSVMLVLIFSFDGGILSDCCRKCKALLYLGEISLEFYLVHFLVIEIGKARFLHVLTGNTWYAATGGAVCFCLSFCLAVMLHKLSLEFSQKMKLLTAGKK